MEQRTLSSQFKQQLQSLMDTLNKTEPHFIRCIKPNSNKCADYFDAQMVVRQLRCVFMIALSTGLHLSLADCSLIALQPYAWSDLSIA